MAMIKISAWAHSVIKDEIKARKDAGERPVQTAESIVDEMIRHRIKPTRKPRLEAEELANLHRG